MTIIRAALGIGLAWLSLGGSARADYMYRYVFDQTNYVALPGQSFSVGVFLQETATGDDPSRLATEGLFGVSVRVRFDEAPAQILALDDILPNTAEFNDELFLFTDLMPGRRAEFTAAIDLLSPPVFGMEIAPNVFRVFLGSFRFTAGSAPGRVSIFALDIPETTDTITDAGFVLDPLLLPASATITVVPEPSTLTLMGLGVLGLIGYFRHHREAMRGPLPTP